MRELLYGTAKVLTTTPLAAGGDAGVVASSAAGWVDLTMHRGASLMIFVPVGTLILRDVSVKGRGAPAPGAATATVSALWECYR
jgi:hypothetical protein